MMRVRFWGVRGSISAPGIATARYGGNTPCISIEMGISSPVAGAASAPRSTLILDAGTGIRKLGQELFGTGGEIFILVTHMHADHIQGFPFFAPLYEPGRRIFIFPTSLGKMALYTLIEQMDGAHFPLTPDKLPSDWECVMTGQEALLNKHGFHIAKHAVNHPGGAFGYRVEHAGRSVVYIPDNEIDPPADTHQTTTMQSLASFCRGADLLIHDSQYTDAEIKDHRGWGHSTVYQSCDLAAAAGVKHLALFHHDPDRADDAVDRILADARARLAARAPQIQCSAAYEGLSIDI